MTSVKIFLSIFFTAACLFRKISGECGYFVNEPESDDNFKTEMEHYTNHGVHWNAFYFVDTDEYDSTIDQMSLLYGTLWFFKVNTRFCDKTQRKFGIKTVPSVVMRRRGINELKLVSPHLKGVEIKKKLHEYATYNTGIQKFKNVKEFELALGRAERDDILVIIFVCENNSCEDIRPHIETMAQLYKSRVKVFKISTWLSLWKSEEDLNWSRKKSVSKKDPLFVYRKFGLDRHKLFGCDWIEFHKLLLKYKDEKKIKNLKNWAAETVIDDETANRFVDVVQYAQDDEDFSLKLKAAERANQLIILYIVDDDNYYEGADKSVEVLTRVFPTIIVIKVNTAICKGVAKQYSDNGNAEIMSFPTFIVRKFEMNLARIVGFNAKKLRFQIMLYKDCSDMGIQSNSSNCGQKTEENSQITSGSRFQQIPILENGSKASDDVKYELKNTRGFDSLVSIIMVAYNDSIKYRQEADWSNNFFFHFISKIVKHGITQQTYIERAKLIINKTAPKITRPTFSKIYSVNCDTTIQNMVELMFEDLPTKMDTKMSILDKDTLLYSPIKPDFYITYQTSNGTIDDLQTFLDNCFKRESTNLNITDKQISNMHIFIEVSTEDDTNSVKKTRNSDIMEKVKMPLRDIPKRLVYNSTTYEMRGVIYYELRKNRHSSKSLLRDYSVYALRGDGTWQLLFDDTTTADEPVPEVNEKTEVTIDFLIYTI